MLVVLGGVKASLHVSFTAPRYEDFADLVFRTRTVLLCLSLSYSEFVVVFLIADAGSFNFG